MSAYTNVTLPNQYSTVNQLIEENEILKFKLSRALKSIDHLEREMRNIPHAVKEWGYVDISDSCGKYMVTLIAREIETKTKGGE